MPPYLAGREEEREEFERLLRQDPILENPVLTGLRGVGKTVLLETFKPMAIKQGWLWVGADLSESASVSEEAMAVRLIADLALVTSSMVVGTVQAPGFAGEQQEIALDYSALRRIYGYVPGLASDKLKAVLETAAEAVGRENQRE